MVPTAEKIAISAIMIPLIILGTLLTAYPCIATIIAYPDPPWKTDRKYAYQLVGSWQNMYAPISTI